ncbi:MAG: hypothetical protein K0S76_1023 [Herbinix sp.]|jgi:hypothetical protein|nr:hypothetical protein [Herbinix sp.]
MAKIYNRINWINKPSTATPLNASNLNKLDKGIDDLDNKMVALESEGIAVESTLSQHKPVFSAGTGKDTAGAEQDFRSLVEGQSDVEVEGFTAVNSVKNGDFSNGTVGWTGVYSTISASDNALKVTGNSTSTTPYVVQVAENRFSTKTGEKWFIRASQRVLSADVLNIATTLVSNPSAFVKMVNYPIANQWYDMSGIITIAGDKLATYVQFSCAYADVATSNGKVMEVKDIMAINLDALGMDTLTKEQCDFMYDHHINGLQGVGSGKIVSVGKNLFDWANIVLNESSAAITRIQNGLNVKGLSSGTYRFGYVIFTRLKSNVAYRLRANNVVVRNGEGVISARDFYQNTMSGAISGTSSNNYTLTFICPSDGRVRINFYASGATAALGDVDYFDIQLEEGTTATTYEPYQSSELVYTLPAGMQLHRLPDGIVDTVEEVNNVKMLVKRAKEYVLQASDVIARHQLTEVDYYECMLPTDCTVLGASNTITKQIIVNGMSETIYQAQIPASDIGKFFTYTASGNNNLCIITAKGTYANLAAAQAALAGTKIIYPLAVPVTYIDGDSSGFKCEGGIEVYPNGTIYQEPVTPNESANAKVYVTYNLSDKAVILANSGAITEINKRLIKQNAINLEFDLRLTALEP